MKEKNTLIIVAVIGIVGLLLITYGCYWLAKTLSYKFWYEDMVKQTIVEMVDKECLRKGQPDED